MLRRTLVTLAFVAALVAAPVIAEPQETKLMSTPLSTGKVRWMLPSGQTIR